MATGDVYWKRNINGSGLVGIANNKHTGKFAENDVNDTFNIETMTASFIIYIYSYAICIIDDVSSANTIAGYKFKSHERRIETIDKKLSKL